MIHHRSDRAALLLCFSVGACDSGTAETQTSSAATSSAVTTTQAPAGTTSSVQGNTSAVSATTGALTTTGASGGTGSATSSGGDTAAPGSSGASGATMGSGDPADTSSSAPGASASSASGTVEASGTSAPPSDACGSALLCDQFDDDTVGMAPGQPWKTEANGGAVEVSSSKAFSGDKSVHVTNTQGAYKRAYFSVDGAPLFPGAGADMYGRLMMWLETSPADGVHWTFIQGEGPSADGTYDIFYRYGGQHQGKLMANFETQGKATDCWDHSATVMPTKRWACLEWRYNTANDEMQFWIDGTEITDIHAVGTGEGCVSQDLNGEWPAPAQFEVLRLGLEKYQEDGPLELWIDDVAVGAAKVGCPAQ